MNNTYNHIEDFLTDESFRNWVNNPSPELDKKWGKWLEANKDKEELLNQAKMIARTLKFKEFEADSKSKRRILEHINAYSSTTYKTKTVISVWYKVAAVLAIIMSTVTLLYLISPNTTEISSLLNSEETLFKQNIAGVKSEHLLSDGTKVYLNSGSSIEYPKTFSSKNRIVKLINGEAFFEVAHDSNRPFIVITDEYDVEVLGTKFNINTDSNLSTVALVSGKVKINYNDFSMELSPGQMTSYNKDLETFTTSNFDLMKVTGWKDGYLVFQDATFDEVIEKLRSWYGVKISVRIDQPVTDWSYTSSFKGESLEKVLLNMQTLRRFEYQIKDDSLIIAN